MVTFVTTNRVITWPHESSNPPIRDGMDHCGSLTESTLGAKCKYTLRTKRTLTMYKWTRVLAHRMLTNFNRQGLVTPRIEDRGSRIVSFLARCASDHKLNNNSALRNSLYNSFVRREDRERIHRRVSRAEGIAAATAGKSFYRSNPESSHEDEDCPRGFAFARPLLMSAAAPRILRNVALFTGTRAFVFYAFNRGFDLQLSM